MSSFMEEYKAIYKKVQSLKDSIAEYREHIKRIAERRNDELPKRVENLTDLLKKIDEYELKIDGFMKLAEKHLTSKNVPTIDAPEGYRVNLNRLRRWSMMIDPMSDDDAYAQRVYLVSKCDMCFLEKKRVEFNNRIAELQADIANGSTEEIKEFEAKIESALKTLREYLVSADILGFSEDVRKANEAHMNLVYPEQYSDVKQPKESYVAGSRGYDLDPGEDFRKLLKDGLKEFYDTELGKVFLPMEKIAGKNEFVMTVNCVPARARLNEMDAGIRNIIFDYIDKNPAGSAKVYVIDGVRLNSSLIGPLKPLEGTFALANVPKNMEQAESLLEEILSSFNDVEDLLENFDTVAEYNEKVSPDKKLPRSLIVIVGWQKAFENSAKEQIKRIITNYERYGISLILADISAEADRKENYARSGLSDYVGENIIKINMNGKGATLCVGNGETTPFKWYKFKQVISTEYAESLKAHTVVSNALGNEYPKRFDLTTTDPYVRGRKKLDLPYGVDARDNVHNISFDNENFAAYLMGASGSGKSTLLHTIITGILRDYHPDDVELWLADFKMSEFAQYIDPLPPHVKYILLDESPELVYDLIDRLTEKMMERQRFFMQYKDMKKVENVPATTYMPVIFVILDEFSIMSQAVSESEVYKLKLQNILAKGRALGIKFIFASQTFIRGIAGLTQTAKDQIQTRIAMKNSYDEINETLELTANTRTDQVKNWMEALPAHYVLSKYRDGDHMNVKRLQVMYFPGSGEEALEPQRKLIRRIKSNMVAVSEERYNTGIDTYVDKKPVIVDGNSFKGYSDNFLMKAREEYIKELGEDYAGDILVSPGDPRRMVSVKFISVSMESRENLVLVARNAEQAAGMSIVLSALKQFEKQGATAHVWAYARNRLYHAYRNSGFADVDCVEGIEGICAAIKSLKEKIERRENGNEIIVLLGMEQICADFSTIDFGTALKGTKKTEGPSEVVSVEILPKETVESCAATSEEEIKEVEAMKDATKDLDAAIDAMMMEKMELGWSFEEIEAEMKRMTDEFTKKKNAEKEKAEGKGKKKKGKAAKAEEAPKAPEVTVEVKVEAEAEPVEEAVEEPVAYNALNDFKYVVTQGSRLGYHFLLVINSIKDMKQTGLSLNLFNHKLAFQLSAEDSTEMFSSRNAASKLPEHICEYSNSLDSFSFRPYLHKGVEWDGWGVDENGEAMRPGSV